MSARINMEKVARGLGAQRRGRVRARAGYFGAIQLVAEVQGRLRVPRGGGRPTDPSWTKRRLVPLAEQTLQRLERLASKIGKKRHLRVEPMQVAALLLESVTEQVAEEEFGEIWDRQLEADAKAGKLDALAENALQDHRSRKSTKL